jgi:hypothetical protein
VTIIDFLFFGAMLEASLGGRQVYWPRAMSIGDDLYYSGFCAGRQVRHENAAVDT